MSSILRTFSQIPVREKYLLVAAADSAVDNGTVSQVSGFTLDAGEHINISSIATEADISANGTYNVYDSFTNGDSYKDLGRQITIYDPLTHAHLAVFRQVQKINGAETEGVGVESTMPETYYANIYLKVWGADGFGVVVVRTG